MTTTHDFYATHESLRLAAERTGAASGRSALYDDPARATRGASSGACARPITPRNARAWP